MHRVAGYPESLKDILSLLPEPDRLTAVKQFDIHGKRLLHRAYKNAESITIILSLYPENERLSAVKAKNVGGSLLHLVSREIESLKAVLTLVPEYDRLSILQDVFMWSLADILCEEKIEIKDSFTQDYLFLHKTILRKKSKPDFFATPIDQGLKQDLQKAKNFTEVKQSVIQYLSVEENSASPLGKILLNHFVPEEKRLSSLCNKWEMNLEGQMISVLDA